MSKEKMKTEINKTIENYNKYRNPEAVAKFISSRGKIFTIKFSGSFCETCGINDYFDDFTIELEDNKIKAETSEIKKINRENYLVNFKIKNDKNK